MKLYLYSILINIFSIRILPHHQDTGGFFVAVLEKLKPLPWETSLKSVASEFTISNNTTLHDLKNNGSEKKRPKKRIKLGYKEDPFVFFGDNEEIWLSVK